MSPASQIYAKISGPIVMVGFGSIGKGTLPLIERHLDYDKTRITVHRSQGRGPQGALREAQCTLHPEGRDQGQLSGIADPAAH